MVKFHSEKFDIIVCIFKLLIKIVVVEYWDKVVKNTHFPPNPSTGFEEKIDENIMQTNGLQKKANFKPLFFVHPL